MLDPNRGFDLIGDIHGCYDELIKLLQLLGYRKHNGVWHHSKRMVIFAGDLIDRGPKIRETLHLVQSMVDKKSALCVMGNHEFAAIAWNTPYQNDYVRPHNERNTKLFSQTLEQFTRYHNEFKDFVAWFYTLPLALDVGKFRVVHACWHNDLIKRLLVNYPQLRVNQDFIIQTKQKDCLAGRALQCLLSGPCMSLPEGISMTDVLGYPRTIFRTIFWNKNPQTIADIVFGHDTFPSNVTKIMLTQEQRNKICYYAPDQVPLFIGHYWMQGIPCVITPNIVCLDYSAVRGGKLVAYRFDGERKLANNKFVWIDC